MIESLSTPEKDKGALEPWRARQAAGDARDRCEQCPNCGASGSMLVLLTTMIRYYACDDCQHRWNVAARGDSGV